MEHDATLLGFAFKEFMSATTDQPEVEVIGADRWRQVHDWAIAEWARDGDHWHFQKLLGTGGQGMASLIVMLRDAIIADRVVIKFHMKTYDSPIITHASDYERETKIYKRLEHLANRYILKMRSNHIDILRERERQGLKLLWSPPDDEEEPRIGDDVEARLSRWSWLYLEYAPYGDLSQYISDMNTRGLRIHTEFIWHVFHGLVAACLDAQRGRPRNDSYIDLQWPSEIVHMDLKPANVFLNTRADDQDRYPRASLADWGVAIEADQFSADNCMLVNGTDGFRPPEQCEQFGGVEGLLLAHSSVYQIGLVIWSLVTGQTDLVPVRNCLGVWKQKRQNDERVEDNRGYTYDPATGLPYPIPNVQSSDTVWTVHDGELEVLTKRCLAWRPRDRPSLDWLLRRILVGPYSETWTQPSWYIDFEDEFHDLHRVGANRPIIPPTMIPSYPAYVRKGLKNAIALHDLALDLDFGTKIQSHEHPPHPEKSDERKSSYSAFDTNLRERENLQQRTDRTGVGNVRQLRESDKIERQDYIPEQPNQGATKAKKKRSTPGGQGNTLALRRSSRISQRQAADERRQREEAGTGQDGSRGRGGQRRREGGGIRKGPKGRRGRKGRGG